MRPDIAISGTVGAWSCMSSSTTKMLRIAASLAAPTAVWRRPRKKGTTFHAIARRFCLANQNIRHFRRKSPGLSALQGV
jgi:hypothetical protein